MNIELVIINCTECADEVNDRYIEPLCCDCDSDSTKIYKNSTYLNFGQNNVIQLIGDSNNPLEFTLEVTTSIGLCTQYADLGDQRYIRIIDTGSYQFIEQNYTD